MINHSSLSYSCRVAFILIALGTSAISSAHANASSWQSTASIEQAVLKRVDQQSYGNSARSESRVKALDRRLRLAQCGKPLETFLPAGSPPVVRTVGVRCTAPKPWKIFVPVETVIYRPVAVANRPLTKGTVLSAADVRIEEREVTRLPENYVTELRQLEGQVLRQHVRDQSILSLSALGAADVIKRGQSVTLMARNSQINVRMRGEALSTGALNERIRVRNLSSQRIVEGTIASGSLVVVDH